MELILLFVLVTALGIGAATLGTDSRDGDDWLVHRHA